MHVDGTLAFAQFVGSLPVFVAVVLAWMQTNARISDLRPDMDRRFEVLTDLMNARFKAQMQALLRVEQVMDARLKSLEQRER
jgi:hypothetical protein